MSQSWHFCRCVVLQPCPGAPTHQRCTRAMRRHASNKLTQQAPDQTSDTHAVQTDQQQTQCRTPSISQTAAPDNTDDLSCAGGCRCVWTAAPAPARGRTRTQASRMYWSLEKMAATSGMPAPTTNDPSDASAACARGATSGALQDRRRTACPTKRRAAVGHCACKASCMQPQVPHAICGSRVGCARGLPDRSAVGRLTQSSQVHHFLRPFCYFTSRTATARCSSSLQRARQTGEGLQQLHRVRVERTCRGLASSSMSMPSSSRACVRMGSRLVKAIATCAAGGQLRHPPLTLWHGDSSVMAR